MPPHRTHRSYPIRGSYMIPIISSVEGGLGNGSVLSFFFFWEVGDIEDSIYAKYGKCIPYLPAIPSQCT